MACGDLPEPQDEWIRNPHARWLLTEGWSISDPARLVAQLALRLVEDDMSLLRLRVVVRTLHPLAFAASYTWTRGRGLAEETYPSHSVLGSRIYRESPIADIFAEAGAIRRRLDDGSPRLDYPYLEDLLQEGATDFLAVPMVFSDGKLNAITLVSDRPGGFREADLQTLRDLAPALARLMEMHAARRLSETLMKTYVGKASGARVLDGLIRRGDGERMQAVLWLADLRDSTLMAESMPAEAFLSDLDDFFDCAAGPVLDQGGEVLSFVGDAVLAMFPISCTSDLTEATCSSAAEACGWALAAARKAAERLRRLNEERRPPSAPLRFGLALHMGDFMYANVGAPDRLQFTAIGLAVNEVTRLQELCKTLGHPILASSAFARCAGGDWLSLGRRGMRGLPEAQEVFAMPDARLAAEA